MIRIKCPNAKCGKELGIDESKAGAVGACPNCGQKFRIPAAAAKAAAKAPAKQPVATKGPGAKPGTAGQDAGKKHWQAEDDFNPYAIKQEIDDKPPPEDDRIDQMVRDDWRQKRRERAWKEVGIAITLMKVLSMVFIAVVLVTFLLVSIDVVLYNFKLEQMANPPPGEPKVDPPEMFIADLFGSAPGQAPAMLCWTLWFLILIVNLAIYGTIIAGAEAMKKLENYGLSMTACILAIVFGYVLLSIGGVLGLMNLMDEKVKLQFPSFKKQRQDKEDEEWEEQEELNRRRREGLPLHDEDDEDDEEEDEDEDRPRPKRKTRRKAPASGSLTTGLILGGTLGVVIVLMAALSVVFPIMGLIMVFVGVIGGLISRIWISMIAFQEDYSQGLMVRWVPFYEVFFMIMRWDECKAAFFLLLGSFVMAIVGGILMVVADLANQGLK